MMITEPWTWERAVVVVLALVALFGALRLIAALLDRCPTRER